MKAKRQFWTQEEVAIVKSHYEELGPTGCAALLNGRTWKSVAHQAVKLGLGAPQSQNVKRRFERKIRVTPGCWIWLASKHPYGYGVIKFEGKQDVAHRVSYQLYCGAIPQGMFVCHKCDNPACVNPDHLFLGTPKDNSEDMVKKGRSTRGEASGLRKLRTSQVLAIRADGRTLNEIAADYGVSFGTIGKIKRGTRWSHL